MSKDKKKGLGAYWKKATPREMLEFLNNWIRNGCPHIGKLIIVEDDRNKDVKA